MPQPSPQFQVIIKGIEDGVTWWQAPYLRSLSFTSGVGWTDGDRGQYRCLYAFLLRNGAVVGRVTFTTKGGESGNYPFVLDKYMVEAARYYDGKVAPKGKVELHQCPPPSEEYQPYSGPDQRPTIKYMSPAGETLEIRNYKNTLALPDVKFQQFAKTPQKVTIVAHKDGQPKVFIYYESMDTSKCIMTSDL